MVARLERKNRAKEEKIEKKNWRVREVRKEDGVDRLLVARLFLFEGEKGGLYKAREFAAMKADNTGSVANRSLVK